MAEKPTDREADSRDRHTPSACWSPLPRARTTHDANQGDDGMAEQEETTEERLRRIEGDVRALRCLGNRLLRHLEGKAPDQSSGERPRPQTAA